MGVGVRRRLSLVSFGCHVDLHGPTNKKLAGHLLMGVSLLVVAGAFHFVAAAGAAAAAVVVVAVFSIFIGRSRHPVTAETAIPDAIPAGCGAQYGARVVNHGRRDLWPVMKRRGFRAWLVCCGWFLFSFFFFPFGGPFVAARVVDLRLRNAQLVCPRLFSFPSSPLRLFGSVTFKNRMRPPHSHQYDCLRLLE